MSWLSQTWSAVWPNLLASVLWSPVALIHISKSNRKQADRIKIDFGLPGEDNGVADEGDHLPHD